jgi:hypothetical protein
MRLLLVREDDRPGRGGSGLGGPHRILHWLRGVRDRSAVVADESGKLGASLSCQVLQPSHCDKERSMTTASSEFRFCIPPLRILISTKAVLYISSRLQLN